MNPVRAAAISDTTLSHRGLPIRSAAAQNSATGPVVSACATSPV
jgi:hypothetical protein